MKDKILLCARDLFLAEGMSHFSMRKVATCAGISATAIYRHFADKEALLFHVLLKGFRIFARYLQRVDEASPPPLQLQATVMQYLDFALREQAYYEMMFLSSEQMTGLKRLTDEGNDEMQQTFELLQQRVQRAIDGGHISATDAHRAAFGIWAYAHGQIALFIAGRTGMNRKAFVEVYRGLMSDYLQRL
ncbi:MAG TPA: TetR/AcrR family transcriptional regulator [Gammaproteobacteria bacterium]